MIGEVGTKSLGNTTERASRASLKSERLKVLRSRAPLVVDPSTPLAEGLRKMQEQGGEPLLVCDGERLLGIVTERDVLLKVLGRNVDGQAPVETVMTRDPDTLRADATVGEAMEMMDRGGYRTIPLTDGEGNLTGLVWQQDVLEYVAEAFPQEILNLPPRPHQLMEAPEGA